MNWKNIGGHLFAVFALGVIVWALSLPLQPKPTEQPPAESEPISLIFVGDINMGRLTGQKILAGDVDFPFANISDVLRDADITFGNLESQLRETGGVTQSPTNEFTFSGPTQAAVTLKNAGFDIVSLANNHMWDYGMEGLTQTIAALDAQGIKHTGAGLDPELQPDYQIFETKGLKIGILAVTGLLNGYEKVASPYVTMTNNPRLEETITKLRSEVDWLFLSLHMGNEYQTVPSHSQEDFAHRMVDLGVDFVVGHHPHVRQTVEGYKGKIIVYSLGNFAFWQPFSRETQTGSMLKVTITSDKQLDFKALDVHAGWQPKPFTEEELAAGHSPMGGITRPPTWKRSDEGLQD